MRRSALAIVMLAVSLDLLAESQTDAEIGFWNENLDNGFGDWSSEYLYASHRFAPHQTLYGGLWRTRRFTRDDNEILAGYYHPVSERVSALIEGAVSPTHEVLPKSSLFGQLEAKVGMGFAVHFGYRHTEYNQIYADVALATVERYWSNYRAAYTYYLGKPENAGSAGSHSFRFAYYYGERNSVGVGFTTGREVERVSPQQVLSTDVDSYVVSGAHWFAPSWAANFDLTWHEQGDLYTRRGFRLGLRHLF